MAHPDKKHYEQQAMGTHSFHTILRSSEKRLDDKPAEDAPTVVRAYGMYREYDKPMPALSYIYIAKTTPLNGRLTTPSIMSLR